MAQSPFLRIGTRGSPLALAQAHETRRRLSEAHGIAEEDIAIEVIKTSGDVILDRPLSEAGGKGLFTREIEEQLLGGQIDLAVHSSKDMPTVLPDGLILDCFLPREDVRDAFIGQTAQTIAALPAGAIVGSSSLRRQAMLRKMRPDLNVVTFRGNVQTRLKKLAAAEVDATMLALAGLRRLGLEHLATEVIETDRFLPAVGQGAIGIEVRADDERTRAALEPLNDADTRTALIAERAFLRVLDGSCRTPIGGYAQVDGERVVFRGEILRPDGSQSLTVTLEGRREDAEAIGRAAGEDVRGRAPADFFAEVG